MAKTKKEKNKSEPKAAVADSKQRIFKVPMLIKPKGSSLDIMWPDGRLSFVLVNDEIRQFPGLREYFDGTKGGSRISLSIEVHDEPLKDVVTDVLDWALSRDEEPDAASLADLQD